MYTMNNRRLGKLIHCRICFVQAEAKTSRLRVARLTETAAAHSDALSSDWEKWFLGNHSAHGPPNQPACEPSKCQIFVVQICGSLCQTNCRKSCSEDERVVWDHAKHPTWD